MDVFGSTNTKKAVDCVCPNCDRPVASLRFAPHLEKCMGTYKKKFIEFSLNQIHYVNRFTIFLYIFFLFLLLFFLFACNLIKQELVEIPHELQVEGLQIHVTEIIILVACLVMMKMMLIGLVIKRRRKFNRCERMDRRKMENLIEFELIYR